MFFWLSIILFSVFFAHLSWKKTEWAVAAIIVGMPLYLVRFKIGFIPMTFLESMILILFIVWLIKQIKDLRFKIKRLRFKWLSLLWITVAAVAVIVSPNKRAALGIWKAYFIEPILFFIVFISTIKNKKDVKLIFKALGFSALYISIFAIYQKFTGFAIPNPYWQAESTRRVTSIFAYPNAIGLYLAPIITLLFGNFMFSLSGLTCRRVRSDRVKNLLVTGYWLLVIGLSTLSIIYAKSEGGLFGLIIGILILFFFNITNKTTVLVKKISIHLVFLTIIFLLVYPFLLLKFSEPYKVVNFKNPIIAHIYKKVTLRDLSGEIRKQQWRETWQMLTDGNFVFGAGLAGYQEKIKPYHQEGIFYNFDNDPDFARKIVIFNEKYKAKYWQPIEIYLYPHNIILNFWSELGLAGLIFFLLIIGKFFYAGFKRLAISDKQQTAAIAAMAAIIAHGMVDVPYFKNDLAILFWLIIGLMIIKRDEK